MTSAANSRKRLSRLSKAELLEKLEALRREIRGLKIGQGPSRDREHADAESDARFRAIADDLPVIVWVFDEEDRPVFFNRAYLEFLGVSPEAGLAGDYHEGIHPDDRERMRLVEQEWARSHGPYRIEYRERRADGVWRWFLDVAVPRFAADGRFLGSIGSSVDITERKQAEAALRESEAWHRELFEDSPVSIWVEDWSPLKVMLDELARQGVTDLRSYFCDHPDCLQEAYDAPEFVDVSRETLKVYRATSKEELYAAADSHHADLEELEGFREQIVSLFEGAGSYAYEARETVCDGTPIFTRMRTVIPPNHRESWSRVLVSIDDISARKAAEADLRDRDIRLQELRQHLEQVSRLSAMGQLSETVSRELGEPLTALMNYAAAARRLAKAAGGLEADRVVEMIDKALNQARQAGELLRHLRDAYVRSDRKTTPQEVNGIVEEALSLALVDPTRAGIRCDVELAEGLPGVVGNRIQLRQVVYSLIRNALEAMAGADRRVLTIETSLDENGAVRVTVGDTGCGLSPEVARRFFGPTVAPGYQGLGRGLSISRGIVDAHGGRLWAEPNPGGGTRFHFTLPTVAGFGA